MFKILFIMCLSLGALDQAVRGEPNLVILGNKNGIDFPAPPVLIMKTGKNISLTCKTVEEKNQNYTDYAVFWQKKKKHKFQNKNDEQANRNMAKPSKLNFQPVMLGDQGIYFCTNTKYNLHRYLHLIVQPSKHKTKTRNGSRLKRYQYSYATPKPQLPLVNYPDAVRDFLDGPLRQNEPQVVSDNRFYDPWSNLDTSNKVIKPNPPVEYPSWKDYSQRNPHEKYTSAFGVLVLIGILICIINHYAKGRPREVPINVIPLPYETINSANRSAAIASSNNRTPTLEAIHRDETDETATVLTSLITPANGTPDIERQPEDVDVPPSYDISVQNIPTAPPVISYDVPPSYDEALANFAIHAVSGSSTGVNTSSLVLDPPPNYFSPPVPSESSTVTLDNTRHAPLVSDSDI